MSRSWSLSIAIAIAAVFLLETTLALSTYGTNDVLTWEQDVAKIESQGPLALYREGVQAFSKTGEPYHVQPFIHPPFMIHVLRFWQLLANTFHLPLGFWMRFTCILANLGSLLVIWRVAKPRPVMFLVVALCPISILVAGFHGNTDQIMIFLVLFSVYAIEVKKLPLVAGALMGLALGVKVVPLIFIPAAVLYLPANRDRIRFVSSLFTTFVVCSLPYILLDPALILRTVFTYGSVHGMWGWSRIALLFESDTQYRWIYELFESYGKTILILSILLVSVCMNLSKVRPQLFAQCGLITALFLFLTPGFGLQYLSWLVPWVVLLTPPAAALYYVAAGVFMSVVYTHWSGGFPWYFANSLEVQDWSGLVVYLGLVCWLVIGFLLLLFIEAWMAPNRMSFRVLQSRNFGNGANLTGERDARISFWLFAAGGLAGVFQLLYPFSAGGPEVEFGDGFEMVAIARNLAAHAAFANPFLVENTGPTAVVPPIYPLLLAALTKLIKQPSLIAMVAMLGAISVNALIASRLPRLSSLFHGDPMPGVFAAVLWLATVRLTPSWDTSYTVAGLIFFCLLSASSFERTKNTSWSGALAGGMAGLLVLLNPSSIMISAPWIVYLLVSRRARWKQAARYCFALVASLLLIVSAWMLRNYHELGAPVLRTNLGMTLYASNNDCAESSLIEDARHGCYQRHHPNTNVSEARLLHSLGEVEYDRRRVADAKNWIAANPHRFRELTLRRFQEFWFPVAGERAYMTYIIWLSTIFSIPGLILMAKRREPVTLFAAAVLLIYPLMYYLVVTDVRYRYPVLWLSLLPAGYFMAAVCRVALRRAGLKEDGEYDSWPELQE
jgi:hypothetical protein